MVLSFFFDAAALLLSAFHAFEVSAGASVLAFFAGALGAAFFGVALALTFMGADSATTGATVSHVDKWKLLERYRPQSSRDEALADALITLITAARTQWPLVKLDELVFIDHLKA